MSDGFGTGSGREDEGLPPPGGQQPGGWTPPPGGQQPGGWTPPPGQQQPGGWAPPPVGSPPPPGYQQPPGAGYPPGYGYQWQQPPPFAKPDNYLVGAILATVMCCLPFGIAGIVYAAQVDSKWSTGDWYGAKESSDKAKMWTYISAGVGLVFIVGYIGLMVAVGSSGTSGY